MATLNDLPLRNPLTPPSQAISEAVWHVAYEGAIGRGFKLLEAVQQADRAVDAARRGDLQ